MGLVVADLNRFAKYLKQAHFPWPILLSGHATDSPNF